jgi:hypothetical protein
VDGQALQFTVRVSCVAAWVAAVAAGVYQAVSIAGPAVRAAHRDRLVGDRGAGGAEPRLPLAGGVGGAVGVEQEVPAQGTSPLLGAQGALGGWGQRRVFVVVPLPPVGPVPGQGGVVGG